MLFDGGSDDYGSGDGAIYFVASTDFQHLRQCASPFRRRCCCCSIFSAYDTMSLNQPLKSNRNLSN